MRTRCLRRFLPGGRATRAGFLNFWQDHYVAVRGVRTAREGNRWLNSLD